MNIGEVVKNLQIKYPSVTISRIRFLEKEGLVPIGTSPDGNLVEIMEVANHPFMIGSQFHPEFLSRPDRPHPLFHGFVSSVNDTVVEGDQIRLIQ